jgi:hypothetical protein
MESFIITKINLLVILIILKREFEFTGKNEDASHLPDLSANFNNNK